MGDEPVGFDLAFQRAQDKPTECSELVVFGCAFGAPRETHKGAGQDPNRNQSRVQWNIEVEIPSGVCHVGCAAVFGQNAQLEPLAWERRNGRIGAGRGHNDVEPPRDVGRQHFPKKLLQALHCLADLRLRGAYPSDADFVQCAEICQGEHERSWVLDVARQDALSAHAVGPIRVDPPGIV